MKKRLRIAVRTLVEAVLRAGDLDVRFTLPGRSVEGIRAHRQIQKNRPEGYEAEVPVSMEVETAEVNLLVGGRIDGVFETDGTIVIEEIKTTTGDLSRFASTPHPCHWGQAKVYAYLLACDRRVPELSVRLTYYQLDTAKVLELVERFTVDELQTFFKGLIQRYVAWISKIARWHLLRDESIDSLDFPFARYRTGQREMAVAVYRALRDRRQALIQASTGIGKTVAVLFPALKAMARGSVDRIFFLTARDTGKFAVLDTLNFLEEKGLRTKRLALTAKEKICFCTEATCNPDVCPYAKGHFDRLPAAMEVAFARDNLDRNTITTVARAYDVCPFEMSLALAQWSDCIVCDYNYAFDPRVYLRRFFDEENGEYAFLVDEAHNLVDRSREMFSARLKKSSFLSLRKAVKSHLPSVYRTSGKINAWMNKVRRSTASGSAGYGDFASNTEKPEGLEHLLFDFLRVAGRWLSKNEPASYREIVLTVYFETAGFLRAWERFDDHYVTCYRNSEKDYTVKLFCLDPSRHIKSALERSRATVFFSATMMPAHYFQDVFGCEPTAMKIAIPSPFPQKHLQVLIAHKISTYYAQRETSVAPIVELVHAFIHGKRGNYLTFFPSYAYMTMVAERFQDKVPRVQTVVQTPGMDEEARLTFLSHFSEQNRHAIVGFAVMGGIFGEGIDLVGDRLSGAIIVGVGLPAIDPERELIRSYFDKRGTGFDFAYKFPGIIRVLQAVGRVIRTDQDRGTVLLVDQRFGRNDYKELLPKHWPVFFVHSKKEVHRRVNRFWSAVKGQPCR